MKYQAIVVLAVLLFCFVTSRAEPSPSLPPPPVMRVCTVEPVRWNPCGIWTWAGDHYEGVWRDIGVKATLLVAQFTADNVAIKRIDYGSHSGVYFYSGKISTAGNSIEGGEVRGVDNRLMGHFTASWANSVTVPPHLTNSEPPQPEPPVREEDLPSVMHFCALNCFTLTRDHTQFIMTAKDGSAPSSVWSVERFSPASVRIHRHDFTTGWNADYEGQISSEGNRLVNVKLDGQLNPNVRFAWGAALDTLPGSNEEKDRRQAMQAPKNLQLTARLRGAQFIQADLVQIPGSVFYDVVWPDGSRSVMSVRDWNQGATMRIERDASFPGVTAQSSSMLALNFSGEVSWQGQWPWQITYLRDVPWTNYWTASEATPSHARIPCDPNTSEPADEATLRRRASSGRLYDVADGTCWHEVGAKRGIAAFEVEYAYDFLYGVGVAQDYVAARHWAEMAARQNDENAMFVLADIYLEGLGVKPDPAQVKTWNSRRAELEMAREKADLPHESLAFGVERCSDDWGRMAHMGFDCYKIVETYMLARVPELPVDASPCRYAHSSAECNMLSVQQQNLVDLKQSFAREDLDDKTRAILAICDKYAGQTLSNGEAFDQSRCRHSVTGQ